MCGRCRHVFNAFETLKRIKKEDPAPVVEYSLLDSAWLDHAEPEAPVRAEAATTATATALPNPTDSPPALPGAPPAAPIDAPMAADKPQPAAPVEDATPAVSDNPLIAGPMPASGDHSGGRHWRALAALAGLLLCLQALYFFRSEIAQQYPQLRPHLVNACDIAGCTIPWGRDQKAIKIESSDLIEPPGKPGRILLTAVIANRGATGHDFPFLEVKLMDQSNQVLASRVLSPGQYLGRLPAPGENIAANGELYVHLNLELAGKAPASGYGLRAFYP